MSNAKTINLTADLIVKKINKSFDSIKALSESKEILSDITDLISLNDNKKLLNNAIKLFSESQSPLVVGSRIKTLVSKDKKQILDDSIYALSKSIFLTILEKKRKKIKNFEKEFLFLDYFFIVSFFIACNKEDEKKIYNLIETKYLLGSKQNFKQEANGKEAEFPFFTNQQSFGATSTSTFFEEFVEFYSLNMGDEKYQELLTTLNHLEFNSNFEDLFYL